MASLTSCMGRAGKALDPEDRAAILARAAELRADGKSATEAGRQAVSERLEEVRGMVERWKPAEPSKIEDVGEKIGGARKDTAESGAKAGRRGSGDDDRPAWARRFKVSQIVAAGAIDYPNQGRWVIRDSRDTDWMGQAKQVGPTFATKEEAEAYVPIAAVGLKHHAVPVSGGQYEIWRTIGDRKRVKVVDRQFATRDEARQYMTEHAAEIVETNTTFGEADLPLPPDRARSGPNRRDGDVSGDDFLRDFGLRGVEFGNWNNQDERQALMNDAYDGLMDLADVLGIPPKAVGLNGDLALAFGARGHGLNSARAHYELDRAVINLTKERGAGSLAHEWFHALDHYFGRQDGKSSSEWVRNEDGTRTLKAKGPEENVSHGFSRGSKVRPELRSAYERVIETIFRKGVAYVEDTEKADKFAARARADLAGELESLRKELAAQKDERYYKRNNKPASAEQLAEFDAIAKRMLDGEAQAIGTEWKGVQGPKAIAYRWTNDSLEAMSGIYKAVRGRAGFDSTNRNGLMDRLSEAMRRYSQRLQMLAEAQQGGEKTRAVPTDFAMNAKELDQGRGGDYWTTPHEMAARAFQGYVDDRVSDRGGLSRFLNYAPENVGILTPWGFKRPYPAGEERVAINKAFDAFVAEVKTKDTDTGVALFSRAPAVRIKPDEAGKPTYHTDELSIDLPLPAMRMDAVNGDGYTTENYAIMPAKGFDSLGHVVLYMKDGAPVALLDLQVYGKRAGVGRKVVETILAANPDASITISNIVPEARGFWAKMGVPPQYLEEGAHYDGTLNWKTYSEANPGAAGGVEEAGRGAGQGPDAGAAEGPGGQAQESLKRGTRRRGIPVETAQALVQLAGGNANVVQSVQDLPAGKRDKVLAKAPDGRVRGVYFPDDGSVWLVADHLKSESEALFVLLHESFHRGLAKTIGPDAKRLLKRMYLTNGKLNKLAREQMDMHGIELDEAIEEALADLAGSGEARDLRGWDKLLNLIRTYLSGIAEKVGLKMVWTDDMIADFVAGIRRAGMTEDVTINTPPGMRTHAQAAQILADAGYTVDFTPEGAPEVSKGGKPADYKAMPKALREAWDALAVDDPAGGAPYTKDTRFSRAAVAAQDLVTTDGGVFDFNRLGATRQDRIRTVIDGARPFWLGALTRDQIADVYGKDIPPVKEYDTLTRAMENQRSKIAQDADQLYNEWAKLGSEANDKLARVMLDATVSSVHPDGEFKGIGGNDEDTEAQRKTVHARLQREFKALPAEAQAMYRKVRDFHAGMLEQLKGALEKRLERQVQDGKARAATLTNIRQMFDKYKEGGPYFPLSRFGDYLVIGTRTDGERVVASYETAGEQQTAARALRKDGFTVKTKTAKDYSRAMDGSAGRFAGDVLTMLNDLDMTEASIAGKGADLKSKLMDDVNQLFIRALPDLSYRKHFAHRKNTPGFSTDMMRGFASSAFHAASHIARLNHADQMGFALEDAFKAVDRMDDGDFNAQTQVLNELAQRHDAAMNPNTHPIAAMLNQVGFVMYLGASPAAGLVNLLQTPMVTLPYLGARHGFAKATAAMGKATKDIMGAKPNRSSGWDASESLRLTKTERDTMRKLQDEGVIDLTQAHDLSAATGLDTGNVARSKTAFAMARAMKIVGWTFHVPEVMNRQVTALTAYRLEMEKSGDQAAAEDAAREAIKRTHFDYSASNRARYMQGNVARVMLQFKQYAQNMTYLLGRAAHQAMKGETAEVRSIARRQLVATLASTFVMAGALGLPGLGAAAGLIGMMVGAMDDDDKPWDWKVELRNLLADTVGKEAGEVISHGLPRALMPWDLAGRVGMGDLWFRSNDREGQSPREAFAEDLKNILGPTAGTLLGLYTASDHMSRGNWAKAAESIVPKFVRDPIQAARMSTEGVTSYSGEHLMDLTAAESLGKLLGFSPASVSEMYEGRNAIKNAESAVMEKRKRLIAQAAQARMQGDTEGAAEAMQDIAAFNRRNPREAIKGESIAASILARRRHERQTQDGTYLPKGRDHLREVGRFATAE